MHTIVTTRHDDFLQEAARSDLRVALLCDATDLPAKSQLIKTIVLGLSADYAIRCYVIGSLEEGLGLSLKTDLGDCVDFISDHNAFSDLKKNILQKIQQDQITVLHTLTPKYNKMVLQLKRDCGFRWIQTAQEFPMQRQPHWLKRLISLPQASQADIIVAHSKTARDSLLKKDFNRFLFIPLALHPESKQSPVYAIKKSVMRVACRVSKNGENFCRTLLRAFSLSCAGRTGLKLLLFTDLFWAKRKIANLLETLKISNAVELIDEDMNFDQVNNIQAVIFFGGEKQSDEEVLQALRAGIPIVAAREAVPLNLSSQENRLEFAPHDVFQLSLCLNQLVDDAKLYARLSEGGKSFYEKNFSHKTMMEQYRALYQMG